jgi:ATP-dependent Lhr-like helicase
VGPRPPQREPADHTRLVYVSLKALAYDVDRNLRALRGIARPQRRHRTGDTRSASAPRCAARRPTSSSRRRSLYLILTSQAPDAARRRVGDRRRDPRGGVDQAQHLALTLRRLAELTGGDPQRIGLSATQNPLEEVGRFMSARGARPGSSTPASASRSTSRSTSRSSRGR